MPAILVAGLGFGDEGKGSVVDYLSRRHGVKTVIRYNGGAQAAHNVVEHSSKRHHTFSQFGSGTFVGARTYLSEFMLVNPFALFSEAKHLTAIGVPSPLGLVDVHASALVTTPFHIASNRLREIARSNARHGSCGMGIGETVRLESRYGIALRVGSLPSRKVTAAYLEAIRDVLLISTADLRKDLPPTEAVMRERAVLEDPNVDYILDCYRHFSDQVNIVGAYKFNPEDTVVFEGAQGILLDQDFGFHPHTTWSNTTYQNAETLLKDYPGTIQKLGLIRGHMTRHGAGPFPTYDPNLVVSTDHNCYGEWQQTFRAGYLDLVLIKYALKAIGGVNGLVVSHLDLATQFDQVCLEYQGLADLKLPEGDSDTPERLAQQEGLGSVLRAVVPVLERVKSEADLLARVSQALDVPIVLTSFGPTDADKKAL